MEIYNDDCFNIFPKIKEKVDLVVVDLPYSTKGQKATACKWDIPVDLKQMWIELKKICKKDCVYVFFCTTKFGYKLIQSNEKWFRYDIVWEKSRKVGFLNANKMPLRKHEMMYIFKEKQGTYNELYGGNLSCSSEVKTDRHPTSILYIPEAPENQEEREHEMMYIFKEKQGTYNPQKTTGHKPRDRSNNKKTKLNIVYGDVDISTGKDTDGTRHPTTIDTQQQ
jgi:hypothetical protein